jgi:hypothetical protein
MILTRTAVGLKLAMAVVLLLGVGATVSHAARPSHSDAMAACRAKYGKKVINAIINKNGTLTCRWQVVRRPATHKEAYEACRKKFGATQAFVFRKKNGWWCRYKARY